MICDDRNIGVGVGTLVKTPFSFAKLTLGW